MRQMRKVLAAALVALSGFAGGAQAVTIQFQGALSGGVRSVEGVFTIPRRYLPGGALPAVYGEILPVTKVRVFAVAGDKVTFWGGDPAANAALGGFQKRIDGDRLHLTNGLNMLSVNFGPSFSGRVTDLRGYWAGPGVPGGQMAITSGKATVVPLPGALAALLLGLAAIAGVRAMPRETGGWT